MKAVVGEGMCSGEVRHPASHASLEEESSSMNFLLWHFQISMVRGLAPRIWATLVFHDGEFLVWRRGRGSEAKIPQRFCSNTRPFLVGSILVHPFLHSELNTALFSLSQRAWDVEVTGCKYTGSVVSVRFARATISPSSFDFAPLPSPSMDWTARAGLALPDVPYTACYCEENVYLLGEALTRFDPTTCPRIFAVVISNPNKSAAIWQQLASRYTADSDWLVVWDYHVVLVARNPTGEVWVHDVDSRLGSPCPWQS